nr:hypothetical protein [Tanacetum cinerariifolium]
MDKEEEKMDNPINSDPFGLVDLIEKKGKILENKGTQLHLNFLQNDINIMFITVYAPQDMPSKLMLWDQLTRLISGWNGHVVVLGDFNEVRIASERFGSVFNARQADNFNLFISNLNLIDVPLGGYKFTWTDKWASKMSKLDRYLISECMLDSFPNITGLILEKGIPDHRPILLKESVADYGPTPFRFYHSWLGMDGFQKLVADTWNSYDSGESDGIISFKKKLQNLKQVIRTWNITKRAEDNRLKKEHTTILSQVDVKIDLGTATLEDINNRASSMNIISEIERNEARDIAQKAKVRFSYMDTPRISIGDVPLNPISEEKRDYLERDVSIDEVKKAVWDCGGDRAIAQKAKVRWALEGDENTSFFHGMLKKKRRQNTIK